MVPMPESVSISSRSAWGTVPLMIWAALTPESRARTQLASYGIMPEASLSPRTMASASPSDISAISESGSG